MVYGWFRLGIGGDSGRSGCRSRRETGNGHRNGSCVSKGLSVCLSDDLNNGTTRFVFFNLKRLLDNLFQGALFGVGSKGNQGKGVNWLETNPNAAGFFWNGGFGPLDEPL